MSFKGCDEANLIILTVQKILMGFVIFILVSSLGFVSSNSEDANKL